MNQYLIPANSKKSQLYFSLFRGIDLIVLLAGGLLTVMFLLVISGDSIGSMVIKLLPIGISVFLVFPIPYYHNVMVFIREMYIYFSRPSKYIWRGWCATYEQEQN